MPGVNVGRVGNFDPTDIAASGAPGIRCTYHADVDVAHGRAWLTDLHARNISVLMLLDNDAHLWESASDPWRDGVARARDTYGDLVDAWQVCNESDAGWFPGTTATIEERAAAHPSSWVMDQDELSEHIRVAREVLGPNAVIIGPGLVSGHPEWAADVDWAPVNMISVHPYAKEPGSASLMALLAAYSAFGWPVTVTEYDATTKAMHTWMAKNMSGAYAFCWSDVMVPGFGLIERPAAYAEFVAANNGEPDANGGHTMALTQKQYERLWQAVVPNAVYHHSWGIEGYWRDHMDELGSPTTANQEAGEWRAFSKNKIVQWTPQGAKVLP